MSAWLAFGNRHDSLTTGLAGKNEILATAKMLARFYAASRRKRRRGYANLSHLRTETAVNRAMLTRPDLQLPHQEVEPVLQSVEHRLDDYAPRSSHASAAAMRK